MVLGYSLIASFLACLVLWFSSSLGVGSGLFSSARLASLKELFLVPDLIALSRSFSSFKEELF